MESLCKITCINLLDDIWSVRSSQRMTTSLSFHKREFSFGPFLDLRVDFSVVCLQKIIVAAAPNEKHGLCAIRHVLRNSVVIY
jgi:hypothetical protein